MRTEPSAILTTPNPSNILIIQNNEPLWRKVLSRWLGVPWRERWFAKQIEVPLGDAKIIRYDSHYEIFWPYKGKEASAFLNLTSPEAEQLAKKFPNLAVVKDSIFSRIRRRSPLLDSIFVGYWIIMVIGVLLLTSIGRPIPSDFETSFCNAVCAKELANLSRILLVYGLMMLSSIVVPAALYAWRTRARKNWLVTNNLRFEMLLLYALTSPFIYQGLAMMNDMKPIAAIITEYKAGRDPIEYIKTNAANQRKPAEQPNAAAFGSSPENKTKQSSAE